MTYQTPLSAKTVNNTLGILLVNLGTPEAANTKAVRHYLKEFLSDPRVVEVPRFIWWFVLNGVILNTRPKKSAAAYATVWQEQGSPLMINSIAQAQALQTACEEHYSRPVHVELAMRYGTPSIESGMEVLAEKGATQIIVLPLYPQYSGSTTATVADEVNRVLRGWRLLPEVRSVPAYPVNARYIEALADSVLKHWQHNGRSEKLFMSFHGIPQEYADKGDPYPKHCQQAADALAEKLGLKQGEWIMAFQSRLGGKPWLKPYTDETLKDLASKGVKSLDLICPGFSADCLETLEEMAEENKEIFEEAGGEIYRYIPCLNAQPAHIRMMMNLINQQTKGWPDEA